MSDNIENKEIEKEEVEEVEVIQQKKTIIKTVRTFT